jgi:hypothetical protein
VLDATKEFHQRHVDSSSIRGHWKRHAVADLLAEGADLAQVLDHDGGRCPISTSTIFANLVPKTMAVSNVCDETCVDLVAEASDPFQVLDHRGGPCSINSIFAYLMPKAIDFSKVCDKTSAVIGEQSEERIQA